MSVFDSDVGNSDHLIFLYVYTGDGDRSGQLTEQIMKPVMEELEGYLTFYAFTSVIKFDPVAINFDCGASWLF